MKKVIRKNFLTLEIIEHSEQDIKEFDMDNEMTTKIIIPEIVFAVNHNKADRAEAQEALRNKVYEYIKMLYTEVKSL